MIGLGLCKKHLNIDEDFKDDDIVLMHYLETAEEVIKKEMDIKSEDELYTKDGDYRPEVILAVLLLAGTWYANRETINYGSSVTLPHGYEYINALNHNWEYQNYYDNE